MINVNLELTDHCNLRCGMCSQSLRDQAHGAPHQFMGWDTWVALLKGLEGLDDQVHLCPHWLGEPTLHPRFEDFVEYAFAVNGPGRLFSEFKLHTNAVIFDEARSLRLLRLANAPHVPPDCFQSIHFSIDAFSQASYLAVKGSDKREKVYRNVKRFLELRAELGVNRPSAHIAFVVQENNASEAKLFLSHWSELLSSLGSEFDLTWDWPNARRDAIYFRPLNSGDQNQADRLHTQVCRELGLVDARDGERLRAAGSF